MAGTLLEEGEGLWVEDCVVLPLLLRKRNISHQLGQQKPKELWNHRGEALVTESLHGSADSKGENPRSHHCPLPVLGCGFTPVLCHSLPSGALLDGTAPSAVLTQSLFPVTPRYNHSIPCQQLPAPLPQPFPPCSPCSPPEPERAGLSCQASAFLRRSRALNRRRALNRSRSRSSVPRAHFSLAGANGRS